MSDHMPQSSEIDALLSEDRRFEPTPAFRAAANVNDPEVYGHLVQCLVRERPLGSVAVRPGRA